MGAQLNIKSQEARDLALELSRLTGETITAAVTKALRAQVGAERLRREGTSDEQALDRKRAIRRIREQGRVFRERGLTSDHDWLYDDDGLPA